MQIKLYYIMLFLKTLLLGGLYLEGGDMSSVSPLGFMSLSVCFYNVIDSISVYLHVL